MRLPIFALLLTVAAPAVAQQQPVAPVQVPQELTDPAVAEKLANVMQVLSKAFLNLPVGEVQAAVEGRQPTAAEKKMTVRDMGRLDDPNFDRNFQQQIAQSKPMIEGAMKALSSALPPMMEGMQKSGEALDRAMQNMPRPNYPNR